MSRVKIENLRFIDTTNRGFLLGARIYSGERTKQCKCGGQFNKTSEVRKIKFPICGSCGETPPSLRIRAKIVGENKVVRHVDIRHSHTGERLTDEIDCLATIKQIETEIALGIFDARKYESKKSKDNFKFSSFVDEDYLAFHKKRLERDEITPYGMKHKTKYCKTLKEFFGDFDISVIDTPHIEKFKNSFTTNFSTRNHSINELRTILKYAHKMKVIKTVPVFDKIETTAVRETVLEIEEARKIIPHIENEMYRLMIHLLSVYALRPSEVRAIQFRDVDLKEGVLYIRRHFSGSKLIDGRKSVKKGVKAQLLFKLVDDLRLWVVRQGFPSNQEDFIFKSPNGRAVYENTLSKAWANTLQKLGRPHVQMYEIRHARGTEILDESNGNMVEARDFLGHSNISTTEKRYARPKNRSEKYIKTDAEIIPITG